MAVSLILRNPLDRDAREYISRAGVTDATARLQLNEFVRGVKNLGLWANMVCWPMRSAQNSGGADPTDTRVFSLGGLGTFNGTRVNGPAWTADGIEADATNETITLPEATALESIRSGLVAFRSTSNALNQALATYSGLESAIYFSFWFDGDRFSNAFGGPKPFFTRNGLSNQNFDIGGSRAINLNVFQTNAFTADDSTDNAFINGTLGNAGARTGLPAINATGTANVRTLLGNSNGMTQSAVLLSTAKWSDTQVAALHSLYKSTLGTGLGLP